MKRVILTVVKDLYARALEGEQVYAIIYGSAGSGKTKALKDVREEMPDITAFLIAHPSHNTELKILNKILRSLGGIETRDLERAIDRIKVLLSKRPKVLWVEEFHNLLKPHLFLSTIKLLQEETGYRLPTLFSGSPEILTIIKGFPEVNIRTIYRIDMRKLFAENIKEIIEELRKKYGVSLSENVGKALLKKGYTVHDAEQIFKLAQKTGSTVNEELLELYEVAREEGYQEVLAL